jgi:hypothetical protein
MAHGTTVEVLLSGDGISPGKLRSKEIAEIIESIEDMIASTVVQEHPGLKKESIIIGLKGVREGSIGLEFSPNLEELTLPATYRITRSIAENDFTSLSSNTLSSLRKLSAFTRRHHCRAEFLTLNGKVESLAVITPETRIPERYLISGETSLHGEITRVGGAEPKIQFKTLEGDIIYCSTDKEIARKAGTKLYNKVEIQGVAEWNSETLKIESFHVTDIADYEDIRLSEAFEELSNLIGNSLDYIDNVDNFVSEIRYGFLGV